MGLLIILDENTEAKGELYWDDGVSFGKLFNLKRFKFYLLDFQFESFD